MFAKVSLKSFVYDIIDVFSFPDEEIRAVYNQYDIEKCFLYLNLTDTDSSSMFFVFICTLDCDVKESEFRKIMFEILQKLKIAKRLDRSDDFWKQFGISDENTKKVMGLSEINNIDNPNICTIAINPKEYFEKFKNRKINKKHKGVRRGTPRMNFESYAEKISSIRQIDIARNDKKLVQERLQVKNTNMTMRSINKMKFASINDKRYYGFDGIVSLRFGHQSLNEVREYKKFLTKIHTVIEKEKDKIVKLENDAFSKNERLRMLRSIYSQPITY